MSLLIFVCLAETGSLAWAARLFTDTEVRGLLEQLHAEKTSEAGTPPPWTPEIARAMLRDWYNGYRFAVGARDAVYNPTLVLYFLKHLQRTDRYPRQMLDANLAADEGKLDYICQVTAGQDAVKQLGMRGEDVKKASRAELMELEVVKEAFVQAEAYAVVALGFDRLVVRPFM